MEEPRDLLRFLTAGSVDDGKSTLLGRLLHDSGGVYEDELTPLAAISARNGHRFDPALVTDGLKAEREQGITIDVAYRYFSTRRRKFIIADTPGHEQYTRNMVTGASTSQVAVLLMDTRKGVLPQTRRHACIVSLLGIRTIIVALNKMDLVDFDIAVFEGARRSFLKFAAGLQLLEIQCIPVSALEGDNVVTLSPRTPWYQGRPLLETLESIQPYEERSSAHLRFPVQGVIRSPDFRGYAGQVTSGRIAADGEVLALPSRRAGRIARIINEKQDLSEAFRPMSVVMSLKEEMDLGRGDMLCDPHHPPAQVKRFRAKLIWMSSTPLRIGEVLLIKHTTQTACMSVLSLRHKIDIYSLEAVSTDSLQLNEIGDVEIETHKEIFCDPYAIDRATGSFIVVHPIHNETLAAGIITDLCADPGTKAVFSSTSAGQARGRIVWITGLSGSGKTTIAEAVHTELLARGVRVELLDGDAVRKHLCRDLGFSQSERNENIRRLGFVARLLSRNGVVVLVSAISPYRAVRDEIRASTENFLEVFVNAPLTTCEERDPKGLYRRARAGELKGFTGIDDPYEPPLAPEVQCRTDLESVKESANKVVASILLARGG